MVSQKMQGNKPMAEGLFYLATYCTLVSCLADFNPEDGGNTFLLTYRLHGVISQKISTFIPTAERASNPTERDISLLDY
jgi:hypothetical protein